MSGAVSTAEAYQRCASITRTAAANFYYGIRLLPTDKRRAMCAVYAFARRIDDIGDGSLGHEEKLRRLDGEARALVELGRPEPGSAAGSDPVIVALVDTHARCSLPLDALDDLIEGVRMDVLGATYESFDDLVLYCRRVAGSIGRLCVAIFGARDQARAEGLADDLGVALQLTNILRDLREDSERGRVYLPAEDLRRFGLLAEDIEAGESGDLHALVGFEADRARQWFHRGIALVPLLDRRSAACVLVMAGIYRKLLDRIEADPARALRERVSLPVREKTWVAARGMLGRGG